MDKSKDNEWIKVQNALLIETNQRLAKFQAGFFAARREIKSNIEDCSWNDDVRFGLQMALVILKEHGCMSAHERMKQDKPDFDCVLRS